MGSHPVEHSSVSDLSIFAGTLLDRHLPRAVLDSRSLPGIFFVVAVVGIATLTGLSQHPHIRRGRGERLVFDEAPTTGLVVASDELQ
jgi:hypothetical protein